MQRGIDLPPPHELKTKKLRPDAVALRFTDSRNSIEFLPLAKASEAARWALL